MGALSLHVRCVEHLGHQDNYTKESYREFPVPFPYGGIQALCLNPKS